MRLARFRYNNNPRGQYLIELLVAIGVFIIVAGAITGIMIDALALFKTNALRQKANWYLAEGIEAVKSIQKQHWADLEIGTFGLSSASNRWALQPSFDTQDGLERRVTIEWIMRDPSGTIQTIGEPDAWAKKITIAVINQQNSNTLAEHSLYVTFAEGSEWLETTQGEFADGTLNNTIVNVSGGGAVTLAQSSGDQFGMPFLITNFATSASLSNANQRVAMRYTPTTTSPINAIHVFLASRNGPTTTYQIGIQEESGGNPTGTFLASGTFTPTSSGWQSILMGTPTSVPVGTPVYIVAQRISGTGNITIRTSQPIQTVNPKTGEDDPALRTTRSTNAGSSWVNLNAQPVFVVVSTTQETDGNAFTASAASEVWGSRAASERFQTQNTALTITGINFAASRSNNLPAGNLICTLTDVTTTTVLYQNTCATPSQVATSVAWLTHATTSSVVLPANHEFRLAFSSPSSSQSSRSYSIPNYAATASSPYTDVTFQGTLAYAESANGATWTPIAGADTPFGLQLASGYSLNGTYLSSVFDTNSSQTRFASLLMRGVVPNNSSMTAQLRTSDTIAGLASAVFVGPDGTPSTSFSSLSTIVTHAAATGTRFIQYKIEMTGDGIVAPSLEDISILYEP